jgi:hypothetical protein
MKVTTRRVVVWYLVKEYYGVERVSGMPGKELSDE